MQGSVFSAVCAALLMALGAAAQAEDALGLFTGALVSGMAEDVELHRLGTGTCGLAVSPHAEAFAAGLREIDGAAYAAGQRSAVAKFAALQQAASKRDICAGVRQSYDRALANLEKGLASLRDMKPAAAPVVSRPPLGPKSTGGDYMEAAGPDRRAWHAKAVAAMGGATREPGFAGEIGECLEAMLTPTKGAEKPAVAALRKSDLAGLTAMCSATLAARR